MQAEHERFLADQPMPLSDENARPSNSGRRHPSALASSDNHRSRPAGHRAAHPGPRRRHGGGRERAGPRRMPLGRRQANGARLMRRPECSSLQHFRPTMRASRERLHGDKLKPLTIADIGMPKAGDRPSDADPSLPPWSANCCIGSVSPARNAPWPMVERQGPDELTLRNSPDACYARATIYRWLRRGHCPPGGLVRSHPVWLITADETEIQRLRALRQGRTSHSYPGSTDPVSPQ